MSYQQREVRCGTCKGKGRLSLTGGDELECPNCEGRGSNLVVQEKIQARVQTRFTPQQGGGLAKSTLVILPHGGTLEER